MLFRSVPSRIRPTACARIATANARTVQGTSPPLSAMIAIQGMLRARGCRPPALQRLFVARAHTVTDPSLRSRSVVQSPRYIKRARGAARLQEPDNCSSAQGARAEAVPRYRACSRAVRSEPLRVPPHRGCSAHAEAGPRYKACSRAVRHEPLQPVSGPVHSHRPDLPHAHV